MTDRVGYAVRDSERMLYLVGMSGSGRVKRFILIG